MSFYRSTSLAAVLSIASGVKELVSLLKSYKIMKCFFGTLFRKMEKNTFSGHKYGHTKL